MHGLRKRPSKGSWTLNFHPNRTVRYLSNEPTQTRILFFYTILNSERSDF